MALADFFTYLFQQVVVLLGIGLFAWIFGRAFAGGITRGLKDAVPRWIKSIRKEITEERAISKALEGRKHYG